MQVGDFFASVRAVVDDGAESGFSKTFLLGNFTRCEEKVAERGLIIGFCFRDPHDEFLWYDQQVNGRLRIDVPEAQAELILIDDVCGDFAVDDFLEKCLFSHD